MPLRRSSAQAACLASLFVFAVATSSNFAQDTIPTEPLPPGAQVPDDLVFSAISPVSKMELIETTSRIVRVRGRIVRVDGFDPLVIKVTSLPDVANEIRIQAMAAGVTTVAILDEFGNQFRLDISVVGDVRQLEAVIKNAFPDASIQAVKVKDSVLLLGWVNQQDQLTPIIEIAEQFHPKVLNYLKVGGVQQVMLKVKIMEVQRARIRRLGVNFLGIDEKGYFTSTPGALTPLNTLAIPFGGPPAASVLDASLRATSATFGVTSDSFIFQAFIDALKEESLLKILAEPNLVTVNGRPANFLSGGEFPITVPQSLGTLSIQYKEFGVRLEFVPFVLGAGRLRMDVAPEVSERDFANSVTLNGNTVPALTTRRVNTQVEMNFGQTLVIAGLLSKRNSAQAFKTPFLGELPWIGSAFRRVREEEAETELLIMVTPELVAPLDAWQVPTEGPGSNTVSPTDRELYGLGFLETPKTGEDCEDCAPITVISNEQLVPRPSSYDGNQGYVPPAYNSAPPAYNSAPPAYNAAPPAYTPPPSLDTAPPSEDQDRPDLIPPPAPADLTPTRATNAGRPTVQQLRMQQAAPPAGTGAANSKAPAPRGLRGRPGLIMPDGMGANPAPPANTAPRTTGTRRPAPRAP